jgi:hypothetical protein
MHRRYIISTKSDLCNLLRYIDLLIDSYRDYIDAPDTYIVGFEECKAFNRSALNTSNPEAFEEYSRNLNRNDMSNLGFTNDNYKDCDFRFQRHNMNPPILGQSIINTENDETVHEF